MEIWNFAQSVVMSDMIAPSMDRLRPGTNINAVCSGGKPFVCLGSLGGCKKGLAARITV
ncbi:MAG: hypothetical protein M3T55_11320 [Pseudomonadota bacterium]|nr:hypothetical protein [Pseudomonadota bacterium]